MKLIGRLRAFLLDRNGFLPQDPVSYRPIGVVRNRVRASRPSGWEEVRSDIILREELGAALDGIEGFSHLIVVFHMNQVPDAARRLRVLVGVPEAQERGVLATRSQRRPNPVGVAVVSLVHRRKNALRVLGLDALDGTPVLDIKPYLPAYDARPEARLPDWAVAPAVDAAP